MKIYLCYEVLGIDLDAFNICISLDIAANVVKWKLKVFISLYSSFYL